MASGDLDFSHRVQEIPQGESLPKTYQRRVNAETSNIPDIQSASANYSQDTNWMSNYGSAIATKASQAIAQRIGGELGKTPQGDLGPTFTDFDKTMKESYQTQASTTLGLQANKLITNANLELASAPRLSPDMIAKSNQQISIGLQNIFANAPNELRPHLEFEYGNAQLNLAETTTKRMINEQRQDQGLLLTASNKQAAELAANLARDGKYDAAMAIVKSTKRKNDSGWDTRVISKEAADAASETVLKAAQSGKIIHDYEVAKANGKGEEYLANLGKDKTIGGTYQQKDAAITALIQHVGQVNSLEGQNQSLTVAQMKMQMATGEPITSDQWVHAQQTLTGTQFANLQTDMIKFSKGANKLEQQVNELTANWGDKSGWTGKSGEAHTRAFTQMVEKFKQDQQKKGIKVLDPEAEANVAASAGGPIASYVNKISNMAQSVDPNILDTVSASVALIDAHHKGENLSGLSDKALAVNEKYNNLNAAGGNKQVNAQLAHDSVYTPEGRDQQKANDESFKSYIQSNRWKFETAGGTAIRLCNIPQNSNYNLPLLAIDTEHYLKQFWDASNGDKSIAESLTTKAMNQKYGLAYYNGREEFIPNPINKKFNIPDNGNGVIHNDVAEQINPQLLKSVQLFKEGKTDFWMEVRPTITDEQARHAKAELDKAKRTESLNPIASALYRGGVFENLGALGHLVGSLDQTTRAAAETHKANQEIIDKYNYGPPPTVYIHYRDGHTEKSEISIHASPLIGTDSAGNIKGGYYIQRKTATGTMPIPLSDPESGPIRYYPDEGVINGKYLAVNGMSALEYKSQIYRDFALSILKTKAFGPLRAKFEERPHVE